MMIAGEYRGTGVIDPVPVLRILLFTLQFGLIAQHRNQRVKRPVVALLRHDEGLR